MPEPAAGDVLNHDEVITNNSIASAAPDTLAGVCAQAHKTVDEFLRREPSTQRIRSTQEQTRISLKVCEEALQRYSLDELSLSYNGGKDCLVLLIIYLSALHTHSQKHQHTTNNAKLNNINHNSTHSTSTTLPENLSSVYILSAHPFKAVDEFVATSKSYYHLSLERYAKPMKEAFTAYLHDYPKIRAIFVGTRRTDPHGGDLQHFDPTDRGWPSFMRIHPVIDWHYAEVWCFIRELGIEYCPLYDLGYTSLGGTMDTHPNPTLKVVGGSGGEAKFDGGFRPAYELMEDEAERLGRDR